MKKFRLYLRNLLDLEPKFLVKPEFKTVHAMTIDGIRYYKAEDVFNNPYRRALAAVDYYNEYHSRISREYLQKHVETNQTIIGNLRKSFQVTHNRVDLGTIFEYITEIERTNRFLKERLNFIIEPDLIYKLASVVFFDESESPYDYDMKYNVEKIARWKKKMALREFLELMPVIELIPSLKDSGIDLVTYSQIVEQIKTHQTSHLSSLQSNHKSMKGSEKK